MNEFDRLQWINRGLLVVVALLGGYYVWSYYVSSKYQALCGGSYWQLTAQEVASCKELKTELDTQK